MPLFSPPPPQRRRVITSRSIGIKRCSQQRLGRVSHNARRSIWRVYLVDLVREWSPPSLFHPLRNIFLSLEPGVNANVRAPNDVDRSGGAVIFHPRLPTRRAPRVLPHLRMHQWRIGRGCFLITCHNSPPTRPSPRIHGEGWAIKQRVFFQIENAACIRALS